VLGEPKKQGNENGYVTLVTPSQDLGEWPLIKALSSQENIFVANCTDDEINTHAHLPIAMAPYVDMDYVWENTSILIMPVYYNDRNGQGRVTTEAHRRGIPVISVDRCGMGEIIPKEHLLTRNASPEEWIKKIKEVRDNYSVHEEIAIKAFYPAEEQLNIFKQKISELECKQKY
jgi:glycosyltransferase involved in cell wall biosynthesis